MKFSSLITDPDSPLRDLRDWRIWALVSLFLVAAFASLTDLFLYTPDSARYLEPLVS